MRGRHHRKKHRFGKMTLTLILALLAVWGISSCAQQRNEGTPPEDSSGSSSWSSSNEESSRMDSSSSSSSSAESENDLESQLIPAPDASPSDWELVLVNRTHQLSEDMEFEPYYTGNGQILDSRIAEQYEQMIADGEAEGLQFILVSAYRTLGQQQSNYDSVYYSYLNQGYSDEEAIRKTEEYIALPNASEHSTGLVVDITEPNLYSQKESGLVEKFEETPEGKWLHEHAADYGFILRYPRGKEDITYIEYESWHFRYVGAENARYIKEHRLTLEEYLDILEHNEAIRRQMAEESE